MRKNGFTLIELIATFALATVILVLLMNIVIVIKNLYTENNIKSSLIIEQSTLSNLVNEKLLESDLTTYISCDDSSFCYIFNFSDGTSSTLVVGEDYIQFDEYKYELDNGANLGEPKIELVNVDVLDTSKNNSFLIIRIPISHKLFANRDFGIDIVHQYNSNKITL